jgi:hypothetical protein
MFFRQQDCQNCSNGPRLSLFQNQPKMVLILRCWVQLLIEVATPVHQAGFRKHRSCTEQLLALTTHIEAGFQRQLKTGVVFVDLSAAYDTVYRDGLMLKFMRTVSCVETSNLFNNMLSNRFFQVFLGNQSSRWRRLNNGLPQGSVLAPILFDLYMSDLLSSSLNLFQDADDIAPHFNGCQCWATSRRLGWDLRRPYSMN